MLLRTAFSSVLLFTGSSTSTPAQGKFGPSLKAARQNAPQIFNAVHNAMRQFGSSLHHNGMSFFQATIPTGTLLYHGAETNDIPKGLEWLAFEIEHSENFARGTYMKKPKDGSFEFQERDQHLLAVNLGRVRGDEDSSIQNHVNRGLHFNNVHAQGCDDYIHIPGYLHVYQATRPLQVLYLDGMAAGKTNMGTNDAEDYVLTGNKSRHGFDDMIRADDLCDWAKHWDIDGFVRMEPGFEVVYCNFRNGGVHQVSATRRPKGCLSMEHHVYQYFEWIQAAAQRYHGIGGGRVLLDYTSMVSAYFYPLNLTNPNVTMIEHPRLVAASLEELAIIREHVEQMTPKHRQKLANGVDWQGITDMVVARYADRLALMATHDSPAAMNISLHHLLDTYIAYLDEGVDFDGAQKKCSAHYLAGAVPTTAAEEFIYAGIAGTTGLICQALFEAFSLINQASYPNQNSFDSALSLVKDLINKLRWSEWKECGSCNVDEVCFIAMWPFGDAEDHYHPGCRNASSLIGRSNYWMWEWW